MQVVINMSGYDNPELMSRARDRTVIVTWPDDRSVMCGTIVSAILGYN